MCVYVCITPLLNIIVQQALVLKHIFHRDNVSELMSGIISYLGIILPNSQKLHYSYELWTRYDCLPISKRDHKNNNEFR